MANWIARANAQFSQNSQTPAAKTAKTPISAVSAACPPPVSEKSDMGFGGFGSTSHAPFTKNNDLEIWGPFTPYCCPISPELVTELHRLIAQYAALYRLADDATARIIEAAKRMPAASVPESIAFFQNSIKEKS